MKTLQEIRSLAEQAGVDEHVICWNYVDALEDVQTELAEIIEGLKEAPNYYRTPWKFAIETPGFNEAIEKAVAALETARLLCVEESADYYELSLNLDDNEEESDEEN